MDTAVQGMDTAVQVLHVMIFLSKPDAVESEPTATALKHAIPRLIVSRGLRRIIRTHGVNRIQGVSEYIHGHVVRFCVRFHSGSWRVFRMTKAVSCPRVDLSVTLLDDAHGLELIKELFKNAMCGHVASLLCCGLVSINTSKKYVREFEGHGADFFLWRGARRNCIFCFMEWVKCSTESHFSRFPWMREPPSLRRLQLLLGDRGIGVWRNELTIPSGMFSVLGEVNVGELRFSLSTASLGDLIVNLWCSSSRLDATRLLEVTRSCRSSGWLDAADALVLTGRPMPRGAAEAVVAVKEVLAGPTFPPLPARRVWGRMCDSTEANWRLLYGCALCGVGRTAEALAEFRRAASGGNSFASCLIAVFLGSINEAALQLATEADDAAVCSLAAASFLRLSGAARQRVRKVLELGVDRGNSMSISMLALDLTERGRANEARALIRKLASVPMRVRIRSSETEYEVRRRTMGMRSALHFGRMVVRRGGTVKSFKSDLRV
jgi:hypothetical protein